MAPGSGKQWSMHCYTREELQEIGKRISNTQPTINKTTWKTMKDLGICTKFIKRKKKNRNVNRTNAGNLYKTRRELYNT